MVARSEEASPQENASRLDALVTRFAGLLLIFGGGILLLVLGALWQLPRASTGETVVFVLPDLVGRHGVDTGIVPVLAGSGGLLVGLGLLVWASGSGRLWVLARSRIASARHRQPVWRAVALLLGGLAFLALVLSRR